MLIRFRVSNFRSLRDPQELSMVASAREGREDVFHHEETGLDLLRVAAIYGANAAGKSNVVRALQFVSQAVRDSHRRWNPEGPIPRHPFLLDSESRYRTSAFEVEFLLGDVRYEYGFELRTEEIAREWLYAYPNQRRQVWFERDAQSRQPFLYGKNLRGNNRAIESLTRKNSLFLSVAAINNHPVLSPLYLWFTRDVHTLAERSMRGIEAAIFAKNWELAGAEQRASILSLLRVADLGIEELEVQEGHDDRQFARLSDFVSPMAIPQLVLKHRAREGYRSLPIEEESAGTQAWLVMANPLLEALGAGTLLCVDELDSSLHPRLSKEVVRLFQNPGSNPHGAQLIFNTHDTTLLGNLLGTPTLHRDQVWFVEKDSEGATHLYPLTDFSPRKDENLERGYLQGRYGAIPFIEPSSWPGNAS